MWNWVWNGKKEGNEENEENETNSDSIVQPAEEPERDRTVPVYFGVGCFWHV